MIYLFLSVIVLLFVMSFTWQIIWLHYLISLLIIVATKYLSIVDHSYFIFLLALSTLFYIAYQRTLSATIFNLLPLLFLIVVYKFNLIYLYLFVIISSLIFLKEIAPSRSSFYLDQLFHSLLLFFFIILFYKATGTIDIYFYQIKDPFFFLLSQIFLLVFTIFHLFLYPFSSKQLYFFSKLSRSSFFAYVMIYLASNFYLLINLWSHMRWESIDLIVFIYFVLFMASSLLLLFSAPTPRRVLALIFSFFISFFFILAMDGSSLNYSYFFYIATLPILISVILIDKYFADSPLRSFQSLFYQNHVFTILLLITLLLIIFIPINLLYSWQYLIVHHLLSKERYLYALYWIATASIFSIYLLNLINHFFIKGTNCVKIEMRQLISSLFWGICVIALFVAWPKVI